MTTAVTKGAATTAIAEYSTTEAELAKLRERLKGATYEVATTAGLDTAKKDRRELVTLRTSLEAKRKEIKAPALDFCKRIDSEAQRITAEILQLEGPIDAQIKVEEARKAEIKAEKERVERERVAAIRERIDKIKGLPLAVVSMGAADLELFIAKVEAQQIGVEFQEFASEAEAAKVDVVAQLKTLHTEKAAQEAEAARLEEERKENERKKTLQDRVDHIRRAGNQALAAGLSVEDLENHKTFAANCPTDDFEEFQSAAEEAKAEVVNALQVAIDQKKEALRLQEEREAYERQQREDQQRREAETMRVGKIHVLIGEIRNFPVGLVGLDSATILRNADNFKLGISLLDDIGRGVYAEFTEEAEQVRLKAVEQVNIMFAAAEKSEHEAAELKRQQDELAAAQKKINDDAREQQEREAAGQAEREAAALASEPVCIGVDLATGPDVTVEVEMVTIAKAEYDRLLKAEAKLDALEGGGVDNWGGYDEAMAEYRSQQEVPA